MAQPAFSFQLVGLKETMDALEQLPTLSMKKTVVRNALKKAAIPIKDRAKQNAQGIPIEGENIVKSIKVGTSLKKSQRGRTDRSRVTVYVGPSHPLASIFEWGTTERYTKSGAYRGFIPPMPFMRQAFDSQKKVSLDLLKEELWRALEKAAKLLHKKALKGTLTSKQRAGLSR
ncbi:MAG: HK97 gp10 family phage protein [Deltaproteobacteria bacterium]|nr:HK97 gp10 family phage protein [Deltaproteobacteria bacterium]